MAKHLSAPHRRFAAALQCITEIAMNPARLSILAAVLLGAGCKENPIIDEPNDEPTAVARVIAMDGTSLDEALTGGMPIHFDFTPGTPIEITLDGSASHDQDGKIVKYQWFSGNLADGGIDVADGTKELRWFPEGADGLWPPDEEKPRITITAEGAYAFVLWVTDDKGAISEADTIKFIVGAVVDPAVGECVMNVIPSVQPACAQCVCGLSEMCRAAVVSPPCDEMCWGLIQCIGANCPDFRAMAAMMDYSCVTTNCMEFIGGATAATPAGMCVTMCPNDCTSMATTMMP